MISKIATRKVEFHIALCIRKCGTPVFFKIAITYLKYNEFSYIGKQSNIGYQINCGANLEHILNFTVF